MRLDRYQPNTLLDKLIIYYRTQKIIKHLGRPGIVFDFGSGDGSLIRRLNNKGFDAYGVDVNQSDRVIVADLNDELPIETEVADYVVSLANIEHLNNPELNMQEAYRILVNGGLLLLTTPTIAAKPVLELMVWLKLIVKEEVEDHKQYFNKVSLEKILREAGFCDINIKYFQAGLNMIAVARKCD